MRDLKECTAEVFRRSNERIKKEKLRRRGIIAAAVPLCLTVIILSAAVLSANKPKSDNTTNGRPHTLYVSAEILAGERSKTVSDSETLQRIADVLLSAYGEGNAKTEQECTEDEDYIADLDGLSKDWGWTQSYGSDYISSAGSTFEATCGVSDKYSITLLSDSGEKTVYILFGNELTDQATEQTVTLSDEDAEELKQLLEAGE